MGGSSFDFLATGTKWQFDFAEDFSVAKLEMIRTILSNRAEDFESIYSRFREDSLISKISQKSGEFALPEDSEKLFDFYFRLNKFTNGKFTPLVGELLNMAGYDKEYSFITKGVLEHMPDLESVAEYKFPTINVKEPLKWDLGAAGKGYLIDLLGKLLEENGISEYCIDAGGDMLQKSKTKVLRVGLENPKNFEQVIGVAEIKNQSICGSSGSRRQWGNFHHIFDINSLQSPTDILSTWVVAESAMVADGIATSLFFSKPVDIKRGFDFEYLILNSDFTVERSKYFPVELF